MSILNERKEGSYAFAHNPSEVIITNSEQVETFHIEDRQNFDCPTHHFRNIPGRIGSII